MANFKVLLFRPTAIRSGSWASQYLRGFGGLDASCFLSCISRGGLRRPASGVILLRFMEKEPRNVLYATSARTGGVGLHWVASVLGISTRHRHKGNIKKSNIKLVPLRTEAGIRMKNSPNPWDHFRHRVSDAYRAAMAIRRPQLV